MFEDNPCFLSLVCARVKKKEPSVEKIFYGHPPLLLSIQVLGALL